MAYLIRLFVLVGVAFLVVPLSAGAAAVKPVVVVYPLTDSPAVAPTLGSIVAGILASQISQKGDIVLKVAPTDTARADYLKTARGLGADFYVSGSVSQIGNQVAAIEQLVSTKSGISTWQSTVTLSVPDDARDSGNAIHDAIIGASAPFFPNIPPPSSNAASSRSAQAPPTTKVVKPQTPLPIPAANANLSLPDVPTPQPVYSKVAVVANFGGAVPGVVQSYTAGAFERTLSRFSISGVRAEVSPAQAAKNLVLICQQNGADALLTGDLSDGYGESDFGFTHDVMLNLNVYDCKNPGAKPTAISQEITNTNLQTAIDTAVYDTLQGYARGSKH